jgi:peptidoglycan hydrolase-like protein with peptidoglycan-binding domain
MLSLQARLTVIALAALVASPVYATTPAHHAPTSGHSKSTSHKSKTKKSKTIKGQRQIDPARATEIQQALIKENYLSGSPTGQWDSASQDAMKKFQADHGWQTKIMPDSRALIKLGLGPQNPETAKVAAPSEESDLSHPKDTLNLTGDNSIDTRATATGR